MQDLREEWRRRLIQARASAFTLRLVDELFHSSVLTIPEVQRLLGISYPGAKQIVQKLVRADILSPARDNAYGKSFQAMEILRVLTGEWTPA
ncbi:MAG: DUF2089 domain-containing protein [Anaerolineae bacterium]|nr:DUF2089 domain-containing protein [Anaerolineae bacterium]